MKALTALLVGPSLCFPVAAAQEANKATGTQQPKSIPAGARVFINLGESGASLAAALKDQQVPVKVVANKDEADFLIEYGKTVIQAGSVFEGTWEMIHIPTSTVVLKCRVSNERDLKKLADSCAKKVKEKISRK